MLPAAIPIAPHTMGMHQNVLLNGRSHSARSFRAFHRNWMIPHISQSFKDQANTMPSPVRFPSILRTNALTPVGAHTETYT